MGLHYYTEKRMSGPDNSRVACPIRTHGNVAVLTTSHPDFRRKHCVTQAQLALQVRHSAGVVPAAVATVSHLEHRLMGNRVVCGFPISNSVMRCFCAAPPCQPQTNATHYLSRVFAQQLAGVYARRISGLTASSNAPVINTAAISDKLPANPGP